MGVAEDFRKFELEPYVDAELLRFATVCKRAGYRSVRLCIDLDEITTFNVWTNENDLHSLANFSGAWWERIL